MEQHSQTQNRPARRRTVLVASMLVVDLTALLVAAWMVAETRHFICTSEDPGLADLGYVMAFLTAAPAGASLLLLAVASVRPPDRRAILDGLAAFLALITVGWLLLVGVAYLVDRPAEDASGRVSISGQTG